MEKLTITEQKELDSREKEAFRSLRTNIEFSGVENKILTVTSCAPGDGKSTISFHLARSFAENGKKTLLIDADLRRSVLLQELGIEGEVKGLSHLLSGQARVNEVIYSTSIPDFYLLPTGRFPKNPTELLSNARFSKLLHAVRDAFAYAIIDTPPLGKVIDGAVVAKQSDASILVIASDQHSRKEVKDAVGQLRASNPNILGAVLNIAKGSNAGYYRDKKYYDKYYDDTPASHVF